MPINKTPGAPEAVKFEGIFGIPMNVIMQYSSEQGNQLPSALHKIFMKLDGLNGMEEKEKEKETEEDEDEDI